jgi:methionyl-tRNA formyltransferase
LIREFKPDLGVALAAPILKPLLFEIPRLGTINLHKGKLPYYRGMPPAFWELYYDEKEVGCTVHRVERGLDTGAILIEQTLARKPHSTVRSMQLALDEIGVQLICEAVRLLQSGSATWKPQCGSGHTHRRPTLKQEARLRQRLCPKKPDATLRSVIKESVFWTYIYIVRPLPRRYLGLHNRQRIVVLLYHRVNDEMRDSLTVGVEQFNDQMEWLSHHFPLIRVDDLIHRNIPRNTSRPSVAVTFDDG